MGRLLFLVCIASCGSRTDLGGADPRGGACVCERHTSQRILIECAPNGGESCSPPFSLPVSTASVLRVEFTNSSGHCSDIRVVISKDGIASYTSPFLAPDQSTGTVDIGPATNLVLGVKAEGRASGCNTGWLGSWAGTLNITTSSSCDCR